MTLNELYIDFIHGDNHDQSCKKFNILVTICWIAFNQAEALEKFKIKPSANFPSFNAAINLYIDIIRAMYVEWLCLNPNCYWYTQYFPFTQHATRKATKRWPDLAMSRYKWHRSTALWRLPFILPPVFVQAAVIRSWYELIRHVCSLKRSINSLHNRLMLHH